MKTHLVKARYSKKLKALGANAKRLRLEKGLTQEQVSFRANISFSTYSTLEAGRLNPTIATLFAIADAMKVNIKDLIDF
ncbi:MAG TPA: transcriptional regulator [Cytophagales bacterium]|nr:transcriptional regulator [Cytophagales bacterium]